MSEAAKNIIAGSIIVVVVIAWFVISWFAPIIPWFIIAACIICWAFGG